MESARDTFIQVLVAYSEDDSYRTVKLPQFRHAPQPVNIRPHQVIVQPIEGFARCMRRLPIHLPI